MSHKKSGAYLKVPMSNNPGRWRLAAAVATLATVAIVLMTFLLWRNQNPLERAVKETRAALRKLGFRTDLEDFDFSVPEPERGFDKALTEFDPRTGMRTPQSRAAMGRLQQFAPNRQFSRAPTLMVPATTNSAVVLWKQDWLEIQLQKTDWNSAIQDMDLDNPELTKLQVAAISGPIRFALDNRAGMAMLLPHLSALRTVSHKLALCSMQNLRRNDKNAAWTNLLALTRIVTAYDVEPVTFSQMLRAALATIAYDSTWQALQSGGWTDEQLARLQQEWVSADFFKSLPATEEFSCASAVDMCEKERRQSIMQDSFWDFIKNCAQNPGYLTSALQNFRSQADYRNRGSYEDEKAMLLFYRDRKADMLNAIKSANWLEMSRLPGITSPAVFQSTNHSRFQTVMNMRSVGTAFGGARRSLPAAAAEAEARRRIILTALALERFHGQHGAYPDSLSNLVPEFISQAPVDFMDGRPLRYYKTGDGHFVLYSVGLEGTDDGGKLQLRQRPGFGLGDIADYGIAMGRLAQSRNGVGCIVWPRPASSEEVMGMDAAEEARELEGLDRTEEIQAQAHWLTTAKRQKKVAQLLSSAQFQVSSDPVFHNRRLSELLRNPETSGTNRPSMAEMLTLHQVFAGAEPERATFELPIRYDALTNAASSGSEPELGLIVDGTADEGSEEDAFHSETELARATNGNTLLVLTTLFEAPGKHVFQAGLNLNPGRGAVGQFVEGPMLAFTVSNLCQFSVQSAQFDQRLGSNFRAKLEETNGSFSADLIGSDGRILKKFSNSTSNGVIKFHWNLVDDQGVRYTNETFDSLFHITLPDSGRSQTLRGP